MIHEDYLFCIPYTNLSIFSSSQQFLFMCTPFYLLTFSQRERFIQFDYCTPRFFHNNLAKTCVILHAFRILRRNLSYMETYTHHRIGLSEEILVMSIFWTILHLPLTLIIILWSSDYMLVLTHIFINHMNLHVLKHFFYHMFNGQVIDCSSKLV